MSARGLLLDIGGVVLRGAPALVPLFIAQHPELARYEGVGSDRDALWQAMLRSELTEREYWARRAAEFGAALGQQWATRDLITRLYADNPREVWLNHAMVELMRDVHASGHPLGALTNDLSDFHGPDWAGTQDFFALFDVIVDASETGILKPDPRAFALGAEAIGLPPREIVYLDDMPWNVRAAAAAGLQAIEVSYDEPAAAIAAARELLSL